MILNGSKIKDRQGSCDKGLDEHSSTLDLELVPLPLGILFRVKRIMKSRQASYFTFLKVMKIKRIVYNFICILKDKVLDTDSKIFRK